MDLSMLAYWTIRQRLLGVPGVANIAIWGEQLKMLQVMVDPKRLAAADVTLDEVQEAVSDALDVGLLRYARGAHIGTGGFVETPNQRFQLRFVAAGVTPETLARVPVNNPERETVVAERRGRSCLCAAGHDRRCRHQRRPGPHAHRREISLGQYARRHARRREGAGGDEARACRTSRSIRRSSGRRPLSRTRSTISRTRCCWAACWSSPSSSSSSTTCAPPSSASSPFRCRCSAAGLVLFQAGVTVNTMILAGFVIALGDRRR